MKQPARNVEEAKASAWHLRPFRARRTEQAQRCTGYKDFMKDEKTKRESDL